MNAVSMSRLSQIKGDIFNALQFLSPQAREEFANELNQWLASQLTKRAADGGGLPHEGVPCVHCGENPYKVGFGNCPRR